MRQDTLSDKIWSIALIVLPALALIFGSVPDFLQMYDGELYRLVDCTLWNPPVRNVMSNLCPLLLVIFAYTLILAVCYYRSQALGTIKAIFVFSVGCLVVSVLALLPDNTVQTMPYALIPATWAVTAVVSFIRMRLEIKRYDFN